MALSVAFSAGQVPSTPQNITLIDGTTGSDVAVTQRRVYITDALGNYLVPSGATTNYITWGGFPGTTTLTVTVLSVNTACNILIDWCDVDGAIKYTDSNTFCFDEFAKIFAYSLCQGLTPPIPLDTNYSNNLAKLWVAIKGGENAVVFGNDIAASQNQLNIANYLEQYQSLFF